MEAVLPRIKAKKRRKKPPKKPGFWFWWALFFLIWSIVFATYDTLKVFQVIDSDNSEAGNGFLMAFQLCISVYWWRDFQKQWAKWKKENDDEDDGAV